MNQSDSRLADQDPLAFLPGGGEMGALIRAKDWATTPLGAIASWSQGLRTTVSICLASDLPMCIIWGPSLVQIYNDGYRVICGGKHPHSLGQNFAQCWREAWPVIGQAHDRALAGDTAFLETQRIFLDRHGYTEECFFTFSFSPIRDERGQVGGLFHPVIEMTAQTLGERRTHTLRDVAARTAEAKSVEEACTLAAGALADHERDVPFALLYLQGAGGKSARLVASAGISADAAGSMAFAELATDTRASWPLAEVARTGQTQVIEDVEARFGPLVCGPYPEGPGVAVALPLTPPGSGRPVGVLIVGVSSRLRLSKGYRDFHELLAAAVTTAVANGRAFEEERSRAEALAELDRAKTAFFSNVSHEFRTPLTLMLGPVEDLLSRSQTDLNPAAASQLEVVNRNGLRLLRLVNTLLDFSRIEAGRVRAAFQPTDLAAFTSELASVFRSACERAGLSLIVDCPPLDEPVFVDRDMWEKVVLNLLSNAFKFTFEGTITVTLRRLGSSVQLQVRDSGTGVAAEEIPRLFERFHRIENASGRTHEGSGIGLSLVQELVKLHGGSVAAESAFGHGTTFTVSLPLGSAHLAADQIADGRRPASTGAGVMPYVEEALQWLPDEDRARSEMPTHRETFPVPYLGGGGDGGDRDGDERPLVLVADDNADMRQYLSRLLSEHYRVDAVPDGKAALAAARARAPDLVLTDVMMPRLDGFGLLHALRGDPLTSGVPVIMLSARAGEESRVEGMEAGADDYLVKPFSAKELLARVSAHLKMARMRRESSAAIQASEEQFRALVSASSDVVYRMNADWTEMRHLEGREFIADTHEPSRSWLLKYIAPDDQPLVMDTIDAAIRSKGVFELEHRVMRVDGTLGWTFSRAIPLLGDNGDILEWFGMASDVTARKQAQEALKDSEQKYRTLFESMDEGYCVIEMIFDADDQPADYRFLEINPAFEKHTGIRNAQGKRMREIAPDHEAQWFENYGRVAVTGEAIRFVNQAKDLDGRWFDVYAFRLGSDGSHKVAVLFNDITDRKHAAEALQRSESRLRAVLEQAPLAIVFTGPSGDIQFRNPMFDALWGRPPHTSTVRAYSEVYSGYHLDGRPIASEEWPGARAVLKGEVIEDEVYEIVQASGDRITCWFAAGPIRDEAGEIGGAVVMFRDITKERRTHEALRASEERRQLALDAAELGMWHVDPVTRATTTDARYRAIFGTTEEWTDYLQAVAVIHPDDQPAVLEAVAAATRLEDPAPYAIEYRVVQPDGSHRWVFAQGRSSIEGAGQARRVTSFDGTVADITDRKRSEEERERLVARLQEQDQRKNEFLATLAHELRNPLAPLRNGLQIIRLHGASDKVEKVRSMMDRQLTHMVRLVDDLLDVSRVTSGKLELRVERLELRAIVDAAVETGRPVIEEAGHELTVTLPQEPISIDGDLTRLSQVVANLLNNSAKYTRTGGHIRLTARREGGAVVVSVKDNGIGIPPAMLGRVFEMFTQVDRTLEKTTGGLGIGLSLVKGLVEMHGGSIEARSDGEGLGSEFVVRLPALASCVAGPDASAGPTSEVVQPALRRILVADDNADSADSLGQLLAMLGNEVHTANDGEAAIELAAQFRPDLVLMDIGMPKLDGYQAARRIRQQPWGRQMTLVALTGWGQEDDRKKTSDAGFDHHMVKPVDADALLKLLAGLESATA